MSFVNLEYYLNSCKETLIAHEIGDNELRKKYVRFLKERRFLLPNIISPAATISPKAKLGEIVAILPQSTVKESEIGDFSILASNSLVNIDAKLGNFTHIDCGGIVLKNAKVPSSALIDSGEIFGKELMSNAV